MNELEKPSLLGKLDPAHYFESLFTESARLGILTEEETERIQMELLSLLARQTDLFTKGASSSVRVETAQSLMQSSVFCIGVCLKSYPTPDLAAEALRQPLMTLYKQGRKRIARRVSLCARLLSEVQRTMLTCTNHAYRATLLEGIPPFFTVYDPGFFAHEIPASIDYPLFFGDQGLLGITYIQWYLSSVLSENEFCSLFNPQSLQLLMSGYDPHYEDLLFNHYERVLSNAVGCVLLQKDPHSLTILPQERSYLKDQLAPLTLEQLSALFQRAAERLAGVFDIPDGRMKRYLFDSLPELAARTQSAIRGGTLDTFFVSFRPQPHRPSLQFEESAAASGELLRRAADEIRDCRYPGDKVKLAKAAASNADDLAALLDSACFFGEDEYNLLYRSLGEMELASLLAALPREWEHAGLDGISPQSEWQELLLSHLDGMGGQKLNRVVELFDGLAL